MTSNRITRPAAEQRAIRILKYVKQRLIIKPSAFRIGIGMCIQYTHWNSIVLTRTIVILRFPLPQEIITAVSGTYSTVWFLFYNRRVIIIILINNNNIGTHEQYL